MNGYYYLIMIYDYIYDHIMHIHYYIITECINYYYYIYIYIYYTITDAFQNG